MFRNFIFFFRGDLKMTSAVAVAYVFLALTETVIGGGEILWDYGGHVLGPGRWHERYPECGKRMQSPINIDTSRLLYDPSLAGFDLSQYRVAHQVSTLELRNEGGHTVLLTYSGAQVTISGGSLPDDYVLDQLHFHWGSSNDRGSEHLLDNQAWVMEMHIVHHMKAWNRTSSVKSPFGLAVLSFFFQIGSHNPALDPLLSSFEDVAHIDDSTSVDSFRLSDLLPFDTNADTMTYFRYYGSLTTPPCHETVIWTIFKEKIDISQQQMETFRSLRATSEDEQPISDNFRPMQDRNSRPVTTNDQVFAPPCVVEDK